MEVQITSHKEPLKKLILGVIERNSVSHVNIVRYATNDNTGFYETPRLEPLNVDLLGVEEFSKIDFTKASKNPSEVIALSSLVRLNDGRFSHLKQLDLDQQPMNGRGFITLAEKVIETVPKGYLISSGSGYHFLGEGILTDLGWHNWMKIMEGHKDLCDYQWLQMSISRGYSTLRLNATKEKTISPSPLCSIMSI